MKKIILDYGMIGFVLIVLQMSIVLGKTICDEPTSTEYSHNHTINQFVSNLYMDVTKNVTKNFMMSSLAGLGLMPNETQEDQKCSQRLSNLDSDFIKNNPDLVEFKDVVSFVYNGPIDKIKTYKLRRQVFFNSRLNGFMSPQLRILPFTSQNRISKDVLTMTFTIKTSDHFVLDRGCEIIMLPIGRSKGKMTIFLPGEHASIQEAEKLFRDFQHQKRDPSNIHKEKMIHVKLPIFKILTETNLTNSLIQFGLGNVFTELYHVRRYYVLGRLNEVIQDTFFQISGFAGIVLSKGNSPGQELLPSNNFVVNRPFLMEMSDDDVIFFKGRVVDL